MHPFLQAQLAALRQTDLRAGADRRRTAPQDSGEGGLYWARVGIRRATAADGPSLAALAALDGVAAPRGPALIAEVAGAPRAVMPLDGGKPFGDPFARTEELIALLELRKDQIRRSEDGGEPRRGRFGRAGAGALRRRFA